MKKLFKKYFWTYIIVFAALGLSGSAAYFSISGLSKLFAGASTQIIIMASFIELAKIITTAALHRYWDSVDRILKWVLSIMVVVVMLITSSGIYGFLADAYTKTSTEMDKIDGEISLIENKKEQKKSQILSLESVKNSKDKRISSLISIRGQQESRIDALYEKNRGIKGAQSMIQQSNSEIKTLQTEIDTLVAKIERINSEIGQMDIEILDLKNSDVASEIGPLKYMSNVVGKPMESIINWFIMMIIFVFDPLAILLIIMANNVYDKASIKESGEDNSSKVDNTNLVVDDNMEIEELFLGDVDVNSNKSDDSELQNKPSIDDIELYEEHPSKEKKAEVVEYIEGEDGSFKRSIENKEDMSSVIRGIDSNPLYLKLLDIFFLDGQRKVGDVIPPYDVFLKDVRNSGVDCQEKIIKNFLTISNLLGIVNMTDKNSVKIIKDYESSKQIISLVSK